MTKIQAVRKEHGKPFKEVVKEFAEQGNSRRFTAERLGIELSYFRVLCDRYDLHRHFKAQKDMKPGCRPIGPGWPKGKSHNRKRRQTLTDEVILAEIRRYPNLSTFQTFADVGITTVKRRFGSWRRARELAMNKES